MMSDDRPMGAQIFNNKQASEETGVLVSTLKTWKGRDNRFTEGVHWFKGDDGNIYWTEAGIQAIRDVKAGESATDSDNESLTDSEPLTLDSLAADFDNALRPHARKVARYDIAQQFQRLVDEEKRLEYQRLIEAANRGDDEALYGFADPLYVVGAIASRNGHKALTGGAV